MGKPIPAEVLHPGKITNRMEAERINAMQRSYQRYIDAYRKRELSLDNMAHMVQYTSFKYGYGGREHSVLITKISLWSRWYKEMGFVVMNEKEVKKGADHILGLYPKNKDGAFKKNGKPISVGVTCRQFVDINKKEVKGMCVIDLIGFGLDCQKLNYDYKMPEYLFCEA